MMKPQSKQHLDSIQPSQERPEQVQPSIQSSSRAGEPSSRLGQRTPVDKKEMLALTNKNFEKLPEVM